MKGTEQGGETPTRMKNNWVNTTLLGVIIAMLGWFFTKGFDKMDALNTNSIETKGKVSALESQVADVKSQLSQMVTRAEFAVELRHRDEAIAELTRQLNQLKRAP